MSYFEEVILPSTSIPKKQFYTLKDSAVILDFKTATVETRFQDHFSLCCLAGVFHRCGFNSGLLFKSELRGKWVVDS
jgi:hypothetical protein